MGIYKRGKTYTVEVFLNGARVANQSGFATKHLAQSWHDDVVSRMRSGELLGKKKQYRFEELMEKYEELHLINVRGLTKMRYQMDLDQKIKPEFKFMKLHDISPEFIYRFRSKLSENLAPKTVNNCLDLLRSIFNLAIQWGMLEKNPCQVTRLKVPSKSMNWWEDWSDVERFLRATKYDRFGVGYRLALECGLRLGEIVGLSKADIDFERNQICVHRQWIDKLKVYGPTKHNKVRYVGFSQSSELRRLLEDAVLNSPHEEALLVTRTGRRLGARKLSSVHFQGWVEKLDLPRITFHDLRHTFASWYMIREDNIWDLMAVLGHSNLKTTMRYAHLSSKIKRVPSLDSDPEESVPNCSESKAQPLAITTNSLQAPGLRLVKS